MMNVIGSMRANELMTRATTVTAADSVSKAIGILKRSKSYEVLVVEKDRVVQLVGMEPSRSLRSALRQNEATDHEETKTEDRRAY